MKTYSKVLIIEYKYSIFKLLEENMKQARKLIAVVGIVFFFIIPYVLDVWWKFIPSAICIFFIVKWLNPKNYIEKLGLKITYKIWVFSIILFLLFFYISKIIIQNIAGTNGYYSGSETLHLDLVIPPLDI